MSLLLISRNSKTHDLSLFLPFCPFPHSFPFPFPRLQTRCTHPSSRPSFTSRTSTTTPMRSGPSRSKATTASCTLSSTPPPFRPPAFPPSLRPSLPRPFVSPLTSPRPYLPLPSPLLPLASPRSLKPGQMLFYESAKCLHGRMKTFKVSSQSSVLSPG